MANEFKIKHGFISLGNGQIEGTLNVSTGININGDVVATRNWVNSSALAGYATQSYVNTAVSNLVDSAPGTLDTLNELAAALGDDPNFATTVTNSIATKLPLAGGTMTGTLRLPWKWNSTDITDNSFYVQRSATEDGFAFGIGTGVSTWFSWDGGVGTKRAIDVWNDGSKILLGDGGHDTEISNNLYVSNHIFHTGDTDTYMQFHAADQWRVVTGGVERLEVNSTQVSISNNLVVTGTVSGSNLNVSNWNTAYGWGNHASAGYGLSTADITAVGLTTSTLTLTRAAGNLTVSVPTFNQNTTGNAASATILQTTRSINGTNFNGSANITTANWGTARTLTIGNTGKSVNGAGNVSWSLDEIQAEYRHPNGVPRNNLGSPTVREMALFNEQFNNKTAFLDPSRVTVWKQQTNGAAWEDITANYSQDNIRRFIAGYDSSANIFIPNGVYSFRIEVTHPNYVFANAVYFYWSSQSHSTKLHLWARRTDNQNWYQRTSSTTNVSSWPGHLYMPFSTIPWLPSGNSSSHYDTLRFEFIPTWQTSNPTYANTNIDLYKMQVWGGYPAGTRFPYTVNEYGDFTLRRNLSAPGIVYANGGNSSNWNTAYGWGNHASVGYITSSGSISGNAATATKLQTTRNIALGGDVSGSANFDGSANITITTTVADDSHNHIISNVDGLQAALDGKQAAGSYLTTSGKAADSDLLDGLDLHTGRNNQPNKVVRTQANGYVDFGWINTTSGDRGTTAPTRIYASNDEYIRYYTPTNFRAVLDLPTRTGGNASGTWSINVTGSSASTTGNAATATTLQTARTLTIGNTGKTFNGGANVSWSLSEIGAQAALTNPVTGTGAAGQVSFFNGTTTQTGDNGLFWDNTNKRLGIGTTSPTGRLQVNTGAANNNAITIQASSVTARTYGVGVDSSARLVFHDNLANSTRMVVDSTGNVGIGTTAPGAKLDVAGNVNDTYIQVRSQDTAVGSVGEGARVRFGTSNEAFLGHVGYIYRSASQYGVHLSSVNDIHFEVINTATSSMTIKSSGNVGIGNTTPASKLEVTGNVAIGYTNAAPANGMIVAGNVGIGTTNPTFKLDVSGNTRIENVIIGTDVTYGDPYRTVAFGNTGDGNNRILASRTSSDGMYFMAATGQGFNFRPNGGTANLVTITSTGNVGIGTSSPNSSSKLDVNGNLSIASNSQINLANSLPSDGLYYGMRYDGNIKSVQIYTYDASDRSITFNKAVGGTNVSAELMRITTSGNVGIGNTSPASKLEVTGNVAIGYTNAAPANGMIVAGNVGIGTTSPTSKLHINGGNENIFKVNHSNYEVSFNNTSTSVQGVWSFINNGTWDATRFYVQDANSTASRLTFHFTGNNGNTNILAGTSTGNVGIGTTSPATALEIVNATAPQLRVRDGVSGGTLNFQSNGSGQTRITWGGNGAISGEGGNFNVDANGTNLVFRTSIGSNERMRITSGGNVGIGTTSPGAGLDVKSHAHIDQYAAGTTSPHTAGYLRLISSSKTGWGPGDELGKIEFYGTDGSGVGARNAASIRAINSSGNGTSTVTFNGELAFYTSAYNATESETVRINSAGNVGIGTTSPDYKLDITNSSNYTHLRLGGAGVPLIKFAQDSYNSANGAELWQQDGKFYLNIRSNLNAFVVDVNGNMGIGTTSPVYKLDVAGTFQSQGNATFNGSNVFINSDNTVVGNNTTDVVGISGNTMYFPGNGNVGIGTTSPQAKLEIGNASGDAIILRDIRTATSGEYEHGIRFAHFNNYENGLYFQHNDFFGTGRDKFLLKVGNGTRMVVTNAGNVGIGTTSPTQKLHVVGNQYTTGNITVGASGNNSNVNFTRSDGASVGGTGWRSDGIFYVGGHPDYGSGAGNNVRVYGFGANLFLGNSTAGDVLTITAGGNVGIGTTNPLTKLWIEGNDITLNTEGSSQAKTLYFRYSNGAAINADSYLTFGTGGSPAERMRITSAGNVGIGTTAPGAKLEISGFSTGAGLKLNYGNSSGTIEAVNFIANGGANGVIGMQMVSAGVGDLWLGGSGGRTLTLYRDGNVGIGTTSPTFKLDVSGTGRFTSTVTAPTFSGALSGNATTATTLQTARTINGVSFNGSANITVADATKLPLTGGTLTGDLSFSNDSTGIQLYADNSLKKVAGTGIVMTTDSTRGLDILLQFERGTGGTKYKAFHDGYHPNADTLTTARTLTIGSTGKTFNGSANVAWSLAEIGAYAATNPSQFLSQPGVRASLSFTAGSGAYNNTTGVITIPTNTNQLTNGAGFTTYTANQAVDTTSTPTFAGLNLGNGNLNTVENIYLDNQIISQGDTNTYMQFHAADQWRVVTGGSERLEVNNTSTIIQNTLIANGNVGIGTTGPGYPLEVSGNTGGISIYTSDDIVAFSDISVKGNIRPIEGVLERVSKSRGVVYDRIDTGTKDNIGFIAQELEEQFPELVVTNPNGTKAVKYQNATAVLFEAVKELKQKIESQEERLNKLEQLIAGK